MHIVHAVSSIPTQFFENFRHVEPSMVATAKIKRRHILCFKAVGCCLMLSGLNKFMGSFATKNGFITSTIMKVISCALFVIGHDLTIIAENQYQIVYSFLSIKDWDSFASNIEKKINKAFRNAILKISTLFSIFTKSKHESSEKIKKEVFSNLDIEFNAIQGEKKSKLLHMIKEVSKKYATSILNQDNPMEKRNFERHLEDIFYEAHYEWLTEHTIVASHIYKTGNDFFGALLYGFFGYPSF